MKRALLINLLLAVSVALSGTVGCKRKPKSPTPIPSRPGAGTVGDSQYGVVAPRDGVTRVIPPDQSVTPLDQGNGGLVTEAGGGALTDLSAMRQDRDFFASSTVYFDFDRSTIRSSEQGKVEQVGQHLLANPRQAVRVEGHCDERGTEGYNVSLGERRALSVREYLVNLGVPADRVDTISYGESRPVALGNTEEAYGRNRRGEFILLTE